MRFKPTGCDVGDINDGRGGGMRIGELAERVGVSVRSLRYYEEQQLVVATRTSGGQRRYDEDAVQRVALIQLLFRAGVGSRDVALILPCVYSGTTSPAMVERLVAERARIDHQAHELLSTRDRLDDVIVQARKRLPVADRTTAPPATAPEVLPTCT